MATKESLIKDLKQFSKEYSGKVTRSAYREALLGNEWTKYFNSWGDYLKAAGLSGSKQETRNEIQDRVAELYDKHSGNVSAIARDLKRSRATVREHLRKMHLGKKPLFGGSLAGVQEVKANLPTKNEVRRYVLTSAQNNTPVNAQAWESLQLLAKHYKAEIFVGTYSYNQNNFGKLAVKRGTEKIKEDDLWYAPEIVPYIKDVRVELGRGLVWCGEMNILPTAVNPLAGLETYSNRKSAIFPHAKLAMRSIPTMQGEGTKLNYTTGTITQKNYIQKKEGLKAEHHHRYAGLLVEVNHEGNWWVRQLSVAKDGSLQDLGVLVKNGVITTDNNVEAITWGDLHATWVEPVVVELSMEMLDVLAPKYQFLHDVLEGVSINRHVLKHAPDPHYSFNRWLRGYHRVDAELKATADLMLKYVRPWSKIIVPDSNHDGWWLKSWLSKYDYRYDPANAELFLKLQSFMYEKIRELTPQGLSQKDVNITEYALREFGVPKDVRFLLPDESFKICGSKIECGMHGHLGPNGSFGSPENLNKIGRRANTAHTHSAGIYNGLYVAGTSSKLKWSYNYGPSSWTNSHIVTYPNGKRAIITIYNGKWRA